MPMFGAIQLEWTLLLRDRGVQFAAFLLAALLFASVISGRNAQHAETAALDEAAKRVQAEWAAQPPKNPHMAAHYGILVYRPTAPLQAIDPGVLPYQGSAIYLEAHGRNAPFLSPASVRAADGRYGGTRFSPLLHLAGGFLALMIGYLIGSREARRRIEPVIFGVGASPQQLILAKATITFALVLLAATPAFLAAATVGAGPGALGRYAVFAMGSLTHLAVLAALGVAAGFVFGAARGGLAAVVMVWALGAMIAPRAVDIAAERILPSTQTELAAKIEADFALGPDGHADGPTEFNAAFERQVLEQYGVESVEDLPVNFDALLMQADEDYRGAVYDRRLGEANERRKAQDAIRAIAWVFSPTPAVLDLSARTAGSHAASQFRFDEEAELFRRSLVERLNRHMAENSRTGDWDWTPDDGYYASFSAFNPSAPGLGDDVEGARPAIAALLVWLGAACAALMLAARRRLFGMAP